MLSNDAVAQKEANDLANALAIANIPTLIPMLVQLTGDMKWLERPYQPTRGRGLDDNNDGGLPIETQAEIREAALAAILQWKSDGEVAIAEPPPDMLVRMLSVSMAEDVPAEYGPMIAAELKSAETKRHSTPDGTPGSHAHPPEGFRAVIVGAGISGICAAARFESLGIDYVVLDRAQDVGGTWRQNRYPGAGVDTPSHLYSYSFASYRWSKYFSLQRELLDYVKHVAEAFCDPEKLQLNTEVMEADYDATESRWIVTVRRSGGSTETISANIVVSAVGAFDPPTIPDIAGLKSFAGPMFHTANWPAGVDLAGKRVAVIGNGASAMQVVPAIAGDVGELYVFQRSPQWAAPFEQFKKSVPAPIQNLIEQVSLYRVWYRLRLGWTFNDRLHGALQKDPNWEHPDRSLNAVNEAHRLFFIRHIRAELNDDQQLMEKVVPDYPPYGKRILLDNGWYRSLTRSNVLLVDDPITEVRSSGIVTEDGLEREVDVIVLATGFDVTSFISSYTVMGRSGVSLREAWEDDDCRAYLGLAVPEFPNFFTLYGPNTQPGHGGSLIFTIEAQVDYIVDLLRQMFSEQIATVEVRRSVYERYADEVDRRHENMVWTHPGMTTYYRNSKGRVVVNSPFRNVDYWHMTRAADLRDYETHRDGAGSGKGAVGAPTQRSE